MLQLIQTLWRAECAALLQNYLFYLLPARVKGGEEVARLEEINLPARLSSQSHLGGKTALSSAESFLPLWGAETPSNLSLLTDLLFLLSLVASPSVISFLSLYMRPGTHPAAHKVHRSPATAAETGTPSGSLLISYSPDMSVILWWLFVWTG